MIVGGGGGGGTREFLKLFRLSAILFGRGEDLINYYYQVSCLLI